MCIFISCSNYIHTSSKQGSSYYFDVATNVRLKFLDHTFVYVGVVGFEFPCAGVHRLNGFFHRLHDQVLRRDRNLPERGLRPLGLSTVVLHRFRLFVSHVHDYVNRLCYVGDQLYRLDLAELVTLGF